MGVMTGTNLTSIRREPVAASVLNALPLCILLFTLFCCAELIHPTAAAQKTGTKPKVRAITAFVKLDRAQYKEQIADTLKMLRAAKAAMEQGGYEVETIRVATASSVASDSAPPLLSTTPCSPSPPILRDMMVVYGRAS